MQILLVLEYITSTPFLLNQRSTTPHIKKAKDNTLAPRPVKADIFGPKPLKQQNKASIPIFKFFYLDDKYNVNNYFKYSLNK